LRGDMVERIAPEDRVGPAQIEPDVALCPADVGFQKCPDGIAVVYAVPDELDVLGESAVAICAWI